jgi:hypothetical protein
MEHSASPSKRKTDQTPPRAGAIQQTLDEGRILILGAQILLGMLYRSVFEPGFDKLSGLSQYLIGASTALIILAFVLLTMPVTFYWIVDRGNDRRDFEIFVSGVMMPAVPVFLFALVLTLYVAAHKIIGHAPAILAGLAVSSAGLVWLVAMPSKRSKNPSPAPTQDHGRTAPTPLADRIKHVLTEARMVLPGAQALLGFQLITTVLSDFDKLPESSKIVHLVTIFVTSLSVALLMAPAARHRIVEKGAISEQFHLFAGRMLLVSMILLALGISGNFYVVARKITGSVGFAVISAAAILTVSYGLWFGYTFYRRTRSTQ